MSIQLLVGLGNPGAEYEQTRHNAGEWFIREIARKHNLSFKAESKFHGETARGDLFGHDIRLLIPTTFMNCSGQAVATIANFYKIPSQNILVAHDELDILPGLAKLKKGGGHGGHNGLRDIVAKLGNTSDFYRLRIGIGHPGQKHLVSPFVLSKAPSKEQQLIDDAIGAAIDVLPNVLDNKMNEAMNALHRFKAQ